VLDGVERVLRAYYNLGSPYQGDEVKIDERGEYRSVIDPNLGDFVKMLASGYPQTKTLLTSRLYPKELDGLEGCIKIELTHMDKDDAMEFFKRQGVTGIRAEIEEVCRAYGFHPLSLRLLSGMIVHDMKYGGDIKVWAKYNPLPKLVPKEHHILELAYNSLDEKKQRLISRISAFRNPMDYDALSIFNDFGSEDKFNDVLIELVEGGMLFMDEKSNNFDLHPIVRKYCYDRLRDKEGVHTTLRDYFAKIPEPEKIESMDDLAPVIELYHHTVRADSYDEAAKLFMDRLISTDQLKLHDQLYYRFGAYQTIIELLRALFPDGEDKLPRLKNESYQEWIVCALANSYSLSGQIVRSIPLFEISIKLAERTGDKKNLAIDLRNIGQDQILIGEFNAAEYNLRRSIGIFREIKDEYWEAVDHQKLGRLLAYRGKFEESEKELSIAMNGFLAIEKIGKNDIRVSKQRQGMTWAYLSITALLKSNVNNAIEFAKKARELADIKHYEGDIIRAEYLLGAANLMKRNFVEAEEHLTEALTRDRKINLVEFEPDILLEFAKLRFKRNHKKEALKFADEALQIADRCEYRLMQADIHNFLAEFYQAAGDLEKAKKHGEIAKERAECGYKPALEKAEKLLNEIERR